MSYKQEFLRLWTLWLRSLPNPGDGAEFLKKERFIAGLLPELREKVEARFPHTFDEALEIATQKFQKLNYKAKHLREGREKIMMDASQLAEENVVGTSNMPSIS